MRIQKLTAFVMAAVCIGCFAGCEKKDDKKTSDKGAAGGSAADASAPVIGGEELSGDNFKEEDYRNKVIEMIKDAPVAETQSELGSVGEITEPEAGSEEAELGNYRLSDSGVKLYYDENEYPTELMLTLERYFTSFPAADYTTYTSCIFPSYIEKMEKFLSDEYDYDLKTSFSKQCSGLAEQMKGDYKITRIKIEPAEQHEEGKDNVDSYLSTLDDIFGSGYSESVKSDSDDLIDACFYVMGEDSNGKESMLVSGYEIIFAVKDGKYYTFG